MNTVNDDTAAAIDPADGLEVLGAALDQWPEYTPTALDGAVGPPAGVDRGGGGTGGGSPPPAGWGPKDLHLAWEPPNDIGNANRLIERFGPNLIFVKDNGWHAFTEDEGRWDRDQGDRTANLWAQDTATAINAEADALEAHLEQQLRDAATAGGFTGKDGDAKYAAQVKANDKAVGALRSLAIQSGNAPKLRAMLETASHHLGRTVDDLDAQPFLFSVANGTLELGGDVKGRVRFRLHHRDDLITRQSRWSYDEQAEAPEWERFLAQVQPDPEMRDFLQRHVGYALTGSMKEQVIVAHWGKGSNGKSTFIETLEWGFGDYAMRLPFESLLRNDRRSGADATPDLARLPGRRWVVASETESGITLSSKTIKDLTERDIMTVRHLNHGFFDFVPQHKLSLMINEKPNIPSADDGTWRRLRLVPWLQKFIDPHERDEYPDAPLKDPELGERLRGELDGILNWALDGFRRYLEAGLAPPKAVSDATAEYRAENDPVGGFVRAVVRDADADAFIPGKALYEAFKVWAEQNSAPVLSATKFGKIAKTKLKAETSGIVKYLGKQIDPVWWREYGPKPSGTML